MSHTAVTTTAAGGVIEHVDNVFNSRCYVASEGCFDNYSDFIEFARTEAHKNHERIFLNCKDITETT